MHKHLALQNNQAELLEIANYAFTKVKPSSILGLDISKAILEGEQIKNSIASTTEF
jgi:hypothetical protein